jgi:iron complex outermembrane receptor protein
LQHVSTDAEDQFNPAAPGASIFDSQAATEDNNDTEHGLKAGINYQLDKYTNLYASLHRSFRMGTVDETFATFPGRFTFLTPQTSVGLDTGFKLTKGDIRLQTGIYYLKLKNEIHFDPTTFSNINLDPTRRYGIEISSQYQASRDLSFNVSLAYTKAQFSEGTFAGNDVPLVAEKTATLTALWKLSPTLRFSGTLNYVGEKWFDNDQNNRFEKIPAYTTIDTKLIKQINDWKFSALINNLLDKQYFEYAVISTFTPGRYNAYPLPERNFQVSISKSFD